MKVYKIVARLRLITEETYSLEDVKRIGGFERVDRAELIILDSGDTLVVEETGSPRDQPDYFSVAGDDTPLAGNGVVLRLDDDFNQTEPKITLDDLKRQVRFWTLIGDTLHPV